MMSPEHLGIEERLTPAEVASRVAAFLQQRGLRHSRQRDVVIETFLSMRGHVTVEALASAARRRDARIGLATVYRTMKLLAECGLASQRQFGDGPTRYEANQPEGHHDHMICTACGTIVEFENAKLEELQLRIARSHRFEVREHKLELYGTCGACRGAVRRRGEAS